MASVGIRQVAKSFGPTAVLNEVSLEIQDREFMTLVGPSGCGKSTLLRIIAGLERQDSGTISIGGQTVDHERPLKRDVAMVFQSYALYPHLNVFDNIALPLKMRRTALHQLLPLVGRLAPGRRAIAADVQGVAEVLRIEPLQSVFSGERAQEPLEVLDDMQTDVKAVLPKQSS